MSRFSKIIAFAASVVLAASCGRSARIEALISDASSTDVIVKLLDINRFVTLDTVAVDEEGKFTYKVELEKGQPEFVYLFHGDTKIASMILLEGDKVTVNADTLGNYTIEGSEESLKLAQVEKDYSYVLAKMNSLSLRIQEAANPSYAQTLRSELGQVYVDYYRSRVKYVMENSKSLSTVPVFYQTLGSDLHVFGQSTDAIHMRNAADSLSLVYPDSKYVKALRKEAEKRFGYIDMENRLKNAEAIGYPDIELPDLKGEKRKLSEVDAKVILVQFWTATSLEQKMFNLEVFKPLYEDYASKGLEIYQVSLDVDKGLWAQVVKDQKHPWVSVCDSRGPASTYAFYYNLSALPALYVIVNGELVDGAVVDEASLRKLIGKYLK